MPCQLLQAKNTYTTPSALPFLSSAMSLNATLVTSKNKINLNEQAA